MARRRGRSQSSLRALSIGLALTLTLGACTQERSGAEETSTTEVSIATTSTTSSTPTTSTAITAPSTTTTTIEPTTDEAAPPDGAIVRVPDGDGPFPTIVLVHGGGWIVGTPESMEPLAEFLTANGFLTVNVPYQLSLRSPGFPAAIDDVVCAAEYAAEHPSSDGSVAILGHSAGAHVGAIAALNPSGFSEVCTLQAGVPDRFIGLAGPYDSNSLIRIMAVFFGGERQEIPEVWDSGNPLLLIGESPELRALLIHGDADPVVPVDFSRQFLDALVGAGASAELAELVGADHADARSPSVVGSLIVDWLNREQ